MKSKAELEELVIEMIMDHESLVHDLERVRELSLPECFIAAGYIRSVVWDRLHGLTPDGRHQDIDVVYFDPSDTVAERDRSMERQMIDETGNPKWSVKNQARMHVKNGDRPYVSTEDAIVHWPETVTAIGVQLDPGGRVNVIAPYGLQDLFEMVVRRSPLFQDREYYLKRVKEKNWKTHWPRLTILEE